MQDGGNSGGRECQGGHRLMRTAESFMQDDRDSGQ